MGAIPLDPDLVISADHRSFTRAVTCLALAASARCVQNARAAAIFKTNWVEDSRAAAFKACTPSPRDQTTAIEYTSACCNAALVGKLTAKASGAMRRGYVTGSRYIRRPWVQMRSIC